jgi:dienelactone hydrolase
MHSLLRCLALLALLASLLPAAAQELDATLGETVIRVPKKGLFTIQLETTLYKPQGEGPFPLVVINHGKAPGDTRFQGRYRPALAVRWFMERGYMVAVPMRQGFSKSEGTYVGGGCNVESNGRAQAEDVKAVLDHLVAQPEVDASRILVAGQSHGGWTTLALGTLNYPGVKGLVNFAGGLRQESCIAWENVLAGAAGSYGKETSLPSLWFYGDNDSFFSTPTYKAMHERYTGAGGKARLVAFGMFGSDAHAMFGASRGRAIWQPEMAAFLEQIGLPSQPRPELAAYGRGNAMPAPPASGFAPLEEAARIPFLRDTGRTGYQVFLGQLSPRAFAIAPNGAWGWAEGGDDALQRALANCNRRGQNQCKLYAVDTDVVWKAQ